MKLRSCNFRLKQVSNETAAPIKQYSRILHRFSSPPRSHAVTWVDRVRPRRPTVHSLQNSEKLRTTNFIGRRATDITPSCYFSQAHYAGGRLKKGDFYFLGLGATQGRVAIVRIEFRTRTWTMFVPVSRKPHYLRLKGIRTSFIHDDFRFASADEAAT